MTISSGALLPGPLRPLTAGTPRVGPSDQDRRVQALTEQLGLIAQAELKRRARPAEIAAWRRQILMGEATAASVRWDLSQSREAVMVRVYEGVRGRPLLAAERKRWLGLLPLDITAADMAAAIQRGRAIRA